MLSIHSQDKDANHWLHNALGCFAPGAASIAARPGPHHGAWFLPQPWGTWGCIPLGISPKVDTCSGLAYPTCDTPGTDGSPDMESLPTLLLKSCSSYPWRYCRSALLTCRPPNPGRHWSQLLNWISSQPSHLMFNAWICPIYWVHCK